MDQCGQNQISEVNSGHSGRVHIDPLSAFDCRCISGRGLTARGVGVPQGRKRASSRPWIRSIIQMRRRRQTENASVQVKNVGEHKRNALARSTTRAHDTGLVFWRTLSNVIILCGSMPADCSVKLTRKTQHCTVRNHAGRLQSQIGVKNSTFFRTNPCPQIARSNWPTELESILYESMPADC